MASFLMQYDKGIFIGLIDIALKVLQQNIIKRFSTVLFNIFHPFSDLLISA